MIKIWNARTLQCLQTLQDRGFHRPENIISAVSYDHQNRRLVIGHEKVQGFGLYRKEEESKVTRTHDGPVLAALYNPSFRLIVSGSRDSTIRVWNTISGDKIFQFNNVHDNFDFSTMTYDRIGRRIISGSRDGIIRIWNFNNGQMLQQMFTTLRKEITQLIYVEVGINKYIMSVGWDRRITVFRDEPENFNTQPAREYNGDVGRCHNDDILTVAFQPPGMIATGGVDGIIVIWNLDSGHTKHILKEPFLNLRSPEEKAVEKVRLTFTVQTHNMNLKVIFAPTPAKSPLETFTPLISCHADGFVRIWNPEVGRMLLEVNKNGYTRKINSKFLD
jgi:WD40 repeat protein